MKESEYIKATNRVKVSMALTILRDVLPGDGCGVTANEVSQVKVKLRDMETKLFTSYGCEEG